MVSHIKFNIRTFECFSTNLDTPALRYVISQVGGELTQTLVTSNPRDLDEALAKLAGGKRYIGTFVRRS